jgi:PilZ domain
MADIKCPNCARDFVRRAPRAGMAEVFLSLFYFYPFKCQLCGERFRDFQWGVRYTRVKEDRREYDRMEIDIPVHFTAENIRGDGVLLNASMGGCRFKTNTNLGLGMILRIEFEVSADLPPVVVDAAVVRNLSTGNAGVEFLRWQESERERFQLFVRGLLIGRGPQTNATKKAP